MYLKLKRSVAVLLTAILCLSINCLPVSAASAINVNVSSSPVNCNATAGSLPGAASPVYKGVSYYFNIQATEDYRFKSMTLYVKESGASSYSKVGAETASGYIRYAYISYKPKTAGTLYYRWDLVTTAGSQKSITKSITITAPSVSLSASSVELTAKGQTKTLTASSKPAGTVTWSSSNTSVATVSSAGKITAVASGTATITAKSSNGASAKCSVKVTIPNPTMSLSVTSVLLTEKGAQKNVTATVTPGSDTISAASQNTSVAKVSVSGKTVIITAVANGNTSVTVKSSSGVSKSISVKVNIPEPAEQVYTISLSSKSISLTDVGETAYLSASVSPSGKTVTWTSSDTTVVRVSSDGTVTAVGGGQAVITAVVSGTSYKASASVSVNLPYISIDRSSVSFSRIGESTQVNASFSPQNYSVLWSSSNESVAAVSDDGVIYATGEGTAVVYAALGTTGKKKAVVVTVVLDEEIPSVEPEPDDSYEPEPDPYEEPDDYPIYPDDQDDYPVDPDDSYDDYLDPIDEQIDLDDLEQEFPDEPQEPDEIIDPVEEPGFPAEESGRIEIALSVGSPYIYVNGDENNIDDVGTVPVIRGGRTLMPVRAVVEAMGGTVDWDGNLKQVTMEINGQTLNMRINNRSAWDEYGNQYSLDSAPVIINSRTMLPIRFIVEYFGGSVQWDSTDKSVYISYEAL